MVQMQVVPYAEDELVLIVPPEHPLAARGTIEVAELYGLSLVGINQGSSVQAVQEGLLRRHGILWRHLHIDLACPAGPFFCVARTHCHSLLTDL